MEDRSRSTQGVEAEVARAADKAVAVAAAAAAAAATAATIEKMAAAMPLLV